MADSPVIPMASIDMSEARVSPAIFSRLTTPRPRE